MVGLIVAGSLLSITSFRPLCWPAVPPMPIGVDMGGGADRQKPQHLTAFLSWCAGFATQGRGYTSAR